MHKVMLFRFPKTIWPKSVEVEDGKRVSIYTRKAGYHFGWDWGPRLVTSGIWRPVTLKAWDKAKIENLQIIQNTVADEKATFTAVFEIECDIKREKQKLPLKTMVKSWLQHLFN